MNNEQLSEIKARVEAGVTIQACADRAALLEEVEHLRGVLRAIAINTEGKSNTLEIANWKLYGVHVAVSSAVGEPDNTSEQESRA